MGYAHDIVLLGQSNFGEKSFGKQLHGGPRIDGLNNAISNSINME